MTISSLVNFDFMKSGNFYIKVFFLGKLNDDLPSLHRYKILKV